MGILSRTGLAPSVPKKMVINKKIEKVNLTALITPAPFIYKPFAGIYNPYPYSCSLLCNHPADNEAREILKKAKDSYVIDGKPLLLAEEVAAIRAELENIQFNVPIKTPRIYGCNAVDSVPEELFRRYTETDSRPLTPAPTLVSAHTRASGSRRCVTPDPIRMSEVREKTLLVLDLRRSHSQETLSWQASSLAPEPPIIRIQSVPTRPVSPISRARSHTPDIARRRSNQTSPLIKRPKSDIGKYELKTHLEVPSRQPDIEEDIKEDVDDESTIKRRGKKKKKKPRDSSRGPSAFQTVDPETQVETLGPDSHNPSARPSLVPAGFKDAVEEEQTKQESRGSLDIGSYLDIDILKLLRRELDEEVVDNEFNHKRRKALQEAMRAVSAKPKNEKLLHLQQELQLPNVDMDFLLSLPRVFSRSSARFELPMDSRMFSTMTPLDYIKEHVFVCSKRKLLYNVIFNRHLEENEDGDKERILLGKKMPEVLSEMMGKKLTDDQINRFRDLTGWKDDDVFNFKLFCGLCALCERLLAPEYCQNMPTKKMDPCHEIETVDFESLARRLSYQNVDDRLLKILYAIKDS